MAEKRKRKRTSGSSSQKRTRKRSQTSVRKQYRRANRSRGKMIAAILAAVLILAVFATVIFWDKGLGAWLQSFSEPVVQELSLSGIESESAVLMRTSGKIIGEQEKDRRIYPASLTKMMTVILALENLKDLNQEITITNSMMDGLAEQEASLAGFWSGEYVRVEDLIYGALLPSGAECCNALADAVSGSDEAFVEAMNQKAQKIGMQNTHFCNSTGLQDPEHYSTVWDMAILLKYCLNNRTFRKMIETHSYTSAPTNLHPEGVTLISTMWRNSYDLTITEGEILGGKTGYTEEAGHCLASFAKIGSKEYILVTAGAFGEADMPLHLQDAVTVYDRLGRTIQNMKTSSAAN